MGNGWHEWPLVLFTVLGQCVAGGLIVSGFGWLTVARERPARTRLARAMFLLWLLMGVGFLASVMHLGSPLRMFNSLNRVGASALSNEIAGGALFFAAGGLWWLAAFLDKLPAAFGKAWLVISMALGLAFVWMMSRVYQIETVPTWRNGYTTVGFFLTVLLGGPLLGALVLRLARVRVNPAGFAKVSAAALLLSVAVIVMQGQTLAAIHSSVQQAATLVPDYALWQTARLAMLALGLGCWLCPLIRRTEPRTLSLIAGFGLVLTAEIVGRILFYGLHMTTGMAIAG